MSQSGKFTSGGGGSGVLTLTGNSGGAVSPTGGNINTVGGNNITAAGNPGTSTITFSVTGTTNHAVQVGNASGSLTSIPVGTTGQVLTGVTGANPVFAAPAASSISITGDSGGALTGNAFTFTGGTTGLSFGGAGTTETLSGTLAIANGGTNATSFATTDGTVYYNGTRLVTTATGTAGQVLTSNGAGVAPTYQAAGGGGGVTSITGNSGGALTGAVSVVAGTLAGASVLFTGSGTTLTLRLTDSITGNNTFLGRGTGNITLSGSENTGVGHSALTNVTTGSDNIAIGSSALNAITDGQNNTAIGRSAITSGSSGTLNVAVGWHSMTTGLGDGNVAIGAQTLASVTAGGSGTTSNVAIGYQSMVSASQAMGCIGIGYRTLQNVTTGTDNIGIGWNSLILSQDGISNVAVGVQSLDTIVSGNSNVAIGYQAGKALTTNDSSNILIGANVAGTAGDNTTTRIGTGQTACFVSGIFGVTVDVSGVPIVVDVNDQLGTVVSSRRFKENIEPLGPTKVLDLDPVSFNFKKNPSGVKSIGLIAEDVAKVMPDMVVYDDEGIPFTVRYDHVSIMLLQEVKSLRAELNELKERLCH